MQVAQVTELQVTRGSRPRTLAGGTQQGDGPRAVVLREGKRVEASKINSLYSHPSPTNFTLSPTPTGHHAAPRLTPHVTTLHPAPLVHTWRAAEVPAGPGRWRRSWAQALSYPAPTSSAAAWPAATIMRVSGAACVGVEGGRGRGGGRRAAVPRRVPNPACPHSCAVPAATRLAAPFHLPRTTRVTPHDRCMGQTLCRQRAHVRAAVQFRPTASWPRSLAAAAALMPSVGLVPRPMSGLPPPENGRTAHPHSRACAGRGWRCVGGGGAGAERVRLPPISHQSLPPSPPPPELAVDGAILFEGYVFKSPSAFSVFIKRKQVSWGGGRGEGREAKCSVAATCPPATRGPEATSASLATPHSPPLPPNLASEPGPQSG